MSVAENLTVIRSRLEGACRRNERDPGGVVLVAVGKNFPAAMIREAAEAGQRHFGENRVQEARDKIPGSPGGLTWHMVGPLQKNKARYAARLFHWIHSVDSPELARLLDRRLEIEGRRMEALVEVKLSAEDSKFGLPREGITGVVREMTGLANLRVRGLMTMPPYDPDPEVSRPYFRELRGMALEIREKLGRDDFDQLSMGMSQDFEVAVEEGATMVRIGTAIFGQRTY
jgi:pyridoxal phosphate enzyme (YggS family)